MRDVISQGCVPQVSMWAQAGAPLPWHSQVQVGSRLVKEGELIVWFLLLVQTSFGEFGKRGVHLSYVLLSEWRGCGVFSHSESSTCWLYEKINTRPI